MREVDRITIEELGVPGAVLMENAGRSVVRALEQRFAPLAGKRITVFCGRGNNGGDGFVVARHLAMRGLDPCVVLLGDAESIRGDARSNYDILVKGGRRPHVAHDLNDWLALKPGLLSSDLLVDAILGTGLAGPVEGFLGEVIRDVASSFEGVPVVAVDIPSGMSSDAAGPMEGGSLRACLTVTFTAPKVGQILSPDCARIGELVVAPIGTPPEVYEKREDCYLNLVVPGQFSRLLGARPVAAHKGDFGHALIVAGSRGKSGAAALAGYAALKAGAGLATVATAQSALAVVAGFFPEVMTEPLPETERGAVSARALEYGRFQSIVQNKHILALGPGLGTEPDTTTFVRRVVSDFELPMLLDADAINAFAGEAGLLCAHRGPLVLTPHPGEMARLLGVSTREVLENRVELARRFAREHHAYLVLKGFRTLIATPEGQVYVNPTGNAGMASGGTGDVLTGLLAGLLAQFVAGPGHLGLDLAGVLSAAVYLHGLAGDLAVRETGEKSLVAGDLIRYVPDCWRKLKELAAPSADGTLRLPACGG
jgi:NAD(P)H-hydrate epimerase